MTDEQMAAALARIDAALAEDFTDDERADLRDLLQRWIRIRDFCDSLGWIGRGLARLAGWLLAMWAAVELGMRWFRG